MYRSILSTFVSEYYIYIQAGTILSNLKGLKAQILKQAVPYYRYIHTLPLIVSALTRATQLVSYEKLNKTVLNILNICLFIIYITLLRNFKILLTVVTVKQKLILLSYKTLPNKTI